MNSWALINVLITFATGLIAIICLCKRKDSDLNAIQRRKARVAKSVAVEVGVLSCLICLFSENFHGEMCWVNKWTIVLVFVFCGELMADYFVNKKCRASETNK